MSENDRDKFVRLAEKRVVRAIKDIRLIGNLSNRSNYNYSDEDVRKIVRTLQQEVADLKARFEKRGAKEEVLFTLD